VDWSRNQQFWDQFFPNALLLHYVGGGKPRGSVAVSSNGSTILATTSGSTRNAVVMLWVDAWTEARLLLGLPMTLPGVDSAREVLQSGQPPLKHSAERQPRVESRRHKHGS
jgi:hypothetical protein